MVDPRTAIVRTGPVRYVVRLVHDCPRLGIGEPGLLFRANPSNRQLGEGRICGEAGETVRSREQPPCAIAAVARIDEATFARLQARAIHRGSGAERPPAARRP